MKSWRTVLPILFTAFLFSLLSYAEQAAPLAAPAAKEIVCDQIKPSKVIGQILDAKTKQPLVGVGVYVQNTSQYYNTISVRQVFALPGAPVDKQDHPITVTKAEGMFELPFTTPSKKELNLTLVVVNEAGSPIGQGVCTAYQGETVEMMPIEIALPNRVTGRVVDEKNNPIPNAIVKSGTLPFTTDAEGRFTDPGVPGHRISWDVAAPGFEHKRFVYWIGDGGENPVIKLVPCKPVTGKVIDANGKGVGGVTIIAGQQYLNILPAWSTVTDENGEFAVRTVPEKGGSMPIFPAINKAIVGDFMHVEPGQKDVVLKLYPMGRFEGTVKDDKGAALIKTNVRVREVGGRGRYYWGQTDEKGFVAIENIAEGQYQADVIPDVPLQAPPTVKFALAAGETFKSTLACEALKPAAVAKKKVSGMLLTTEGKPALHTRVSVSYRLKGDPAGLYHEGNGVTEVNGRFEIELYQTNNNFERKRAVMHEIPKPAGDDQVRIVAYLDTLDKRVLDETREWPNGMANDVGELKTSLDPERVITVTATHSTGGAFKPYMMDVMDAAGKKLSWRLRPVYTPGATQLRLCVFKNGELKAKLADDAEMQVDAVIPSKDYEKLNVLFPDPRIVEYLLTDAGGKPVKGITLYKRTFPKDVYKGYTISSDKDGKIRFECSPKAEGTFILFGELNYEVYEGAIAAGDKPINETLKLVSSTSKLIGQVRDQDGNPMSKSNVHIGFSIGDRMSSSRQIELKDDGTYELFVPKNTKVSISGGLTKGGDYFSGRSKEIVVAEGKTETLDLLMKLGMGAGPSGPPKAKLPGPPPFPKPAKPVPPPENLEF
jgi:hypothetical protein